MEPTVAIGAAVKTAGYVKTASEFWGRLQPTLRSKIRAKVEKHFKSFTSYLDITYKKTSTVQLICSRSTNSALEDVYVSCKFNIVDAPDSHINDTQLIGDIRNGKRVVVRGNGGSGKTLFMKKLWTSVYSEPDGKIPVFIELRKFNEMEDVDILTLIRYTLSAGSDLSIDLFHELATDGSFLLIFDGFDEVSIEKRVAVEKQLLEFEQSYKKCSLVISSRPNETFIGWKAFQIFDVLPFSREQILELISKTPLDESLVAKFKNLVTDKFFDRYQEFLSSPLLALMMLVTFKQKAEISDNIIDFYDNAFHALYSEHDAIKESYKRPHCLSINQFRHIFSTFCMFTYYQEKFEMREAEIREFIQRSLDHVNLTRDSDKKINCSVDDFLHEVLDAVNLMRKDGISYLFIHRSFQEFFAANWVINIDSKRTEKLLEDLAMRPSDNVLKLAYQMNKIKVDEHYIIPYYERLVGAESIFRIKPSFKARWPYVEGYALKITWTLAKVRREKKFIPTIFPSWDNGEAGIYYTNLDKLVFEGKLQEKFLRCLETALNGSRPSKFVKTFAHDERHGIMLSIQVSKDEVKIFQHLAEDEDPENITDQYIANDMKYSAKIEGALDQINAMLHELNKMVNLHIANIKDGHSKSEKNLDDMFF